MRSTLHNLPEIVSALTRHRLATSAMKKLNVAKEVVDLQLARAQDVAETVTLAKLKLGEMINSLPKNSGGDRKSEDFKIKNDTPVDFEKPKPKKVFSAISPFSGFLRKNSGRLVGASSKHLPTCNEG